MRKILLLAAATAMSIALLAGTASAAGTVVVTSADTGNGWYSGDTRPPGKGTFEAGPATPPLGAGSFELRTIGSSEKVQLLTDRYDGTALADIDGIGYSTYRDPASTGYVGTVPALNLRVSLDGDETPDTYMVYEPYQDQGEPAVQTGVWQDWDAYAGGAAKWWLSSGAGGCGQSTPCTWSAILAQFPDAAVQEGVSCGNATFPKPVCPGSLGVNQGSGNSGTIANADALYVSVSGDRTTYDFDIRPTSADQCKKGGWANYGSVFANQGDCVSYVATNGRNEPGKNTK